MRNIVLILILFATMVAARRTEAQTLPVILKTDTVSVACAQTDTFHVPITVKNFKNVGSCQFTVSWTPVANLQLDTILMNPAFLGATVNVNFDTTTNIGTGKFTFTWTKLGGGTYPDNSRIFTMAFRRTGGGFTSIKINSAVTPIEITDANADELPFSIVFGSVIPLDAIPPTLTCPANVVQDASVPTSVVGLAPVSADNCQIIQTGWTSIGATATSQPTDPDASGQVFGFGQSTVTYTVTDAGNNTTTCAFTVTINPSSTSDTLTIYAANAVKNCGEALSIDIAALNFDSLGSLQFSANWNKTVLKFDSVTYNGSALQLSGINFGTGQATNGFLSFSWTTSALSGTTIAQGALLFRIHFTVIGADNSNTAVGFGNFPTAQEAYTSATFPPAEVPVLFIAGQVSVEDTSAPTLVCPANQSVMTPSGVITADFTNLQPTTLTDNCSGVVALAYVRTGTTPGSGTGNANYTYNAGLTTVVYTATDGAGNTATCSFTVLVDAGLPVGLVLDSIAADCQNASNILVDFHVSNFSDVIGLQTVITWDPTVLMFDTVSTTYAGLGLQPFNFSSSDYTNGILRYLGGTNNPAGWPNIPDGGAFFTISFKVLNPNGATDINFFGYPDVVNSVYQSLPVALTNGYFSNSADLNGPVFSLCPPAVSVNAPANNCMVPVSLVDPVATDACSGLESIISSKSDTIFTVGITTVTYTAKDVAGNTTTCVQSVTVLDITAPTLTGCPANIFAYTVANDCSASVTWTPPTATDACGNAAVSLVPSATPGSVFVIGTELVVYQAIDAALNASTCSFSVTVLDSIRPEFQNCPGDIMAVPLPGNTCYGTAAFDVPTAFDNCTDAGDLLYENLTIFNSNDTFPAGPSAVIFKATDASGNTTICSFTVTVEDTEAPFIQCSPDITVNTAADTCGAFPLWTIFQAFDNCDTTVTVGIGSYDPGDYFPLGTRTVIYAAADNAGNISTCSFKVTVVDAEPPVITGCPGPIIVELPATDCDTILFWTEPLVSDNCTLGSVTSTEGPGFNFPAGQTTVTYTAEDASGNSATCLLLVNVIDKVKPVFANCPADTLLTNVSPCGVLIDWIRPTYSDNCTLYQNDPALDTLYYSETKSPSDTLFIGDNKITLLITDASGNIDVCEFHIVLEGTLNVGFVNVPNDTTIALTTGCSQVLNFVIPTVTGFCTTPTVVADPPSGSIFPIGVTTVLFSAVAPNGGTIVDSFKVTITETTPPIMICPSGEIVVSAAGVVISDPSNFITAFDTVSGCAGIQLQFATPSATDNCSFSPAVTQIDGPISSAIFAIGKDTLRFRAIDAAGNTAVCAVPISVEAIPALQLSIDPVPACPGETVTLTVAAIPGATYSWTGPNPPYATTNTITIANLDAGKDGAYSVQANLNGCQTQPVSGEVVMVVTPIANDDLGFAINPNTTDTFNVLTNDIFFPATDVTVTLMNQVPGLSYIGDGNFVYTAGTTISFIYEVCSQTCNVCDMADATITVADSECKYVPNVITPNGDGVNDWLEIPCLDSGNFRNNAIVIYNQWGDKVFEASPYSNDAANAWKGTLNGEDGKNLPDGVYYFIFNPGPSEVPLKGFVEVYR